jgi:predicted nucleic acid-binding protein
MYGYKGEVAPLRIYMDACCLNRPFDDQSKDNVRFEAEAIVSILKRCNLGREWKLIGSDIIDLEISKCRDAVKRQKVLLLHYSAVEKVKNNTEIQSRAANFRRYNIKLFDSLHLAAAEYANVDIFLTTDGQLIKTAARSDIKIRVANPLAYYMEVLNHEQFGNRLQ